MPPKYIEVHPNFIKAHDLLKNIKQFKLTSEEFCKQGKIFQNALYKGINVAGWSPEGLTNTFLEEYFSLNNNQIGIDWYFQCFFMWQRLKGEFDKREKRGGGIRSSKIRELEKMIYEIFSTGVKKNKIKFIRSDESPKLKIPDVAIQCHDFFWWIKTSGA
jgi:hypothetical protein